MQTRWSYTSCSPLLQIIEHLEIVVVCPWYFQLSSSLSYLPLVSLAELLSALEILDNMLVRR